MNDRPSLRPEARPAHWSELDEAQQSALVKIMRMIKQAADALTPASDAKPVPNWISSQRTSQTAFLSGGRGTGKSTVLFSLIRACIPETQWNGPDEHDTTPLASDVKRMRPKLHHQVVWLEPIDMEITEQANLLAAIMARIEFACHRVRQQEAGAARATGTRGLLDLPAGTQDAFGELRRLQNSVALAWDAESVVRSARSNLDAYAADMHRIEQCRLQLNAKLRTVLDGLAEFAFVDTTIRNPLFVLPIDDFDLNPVRSLELLKLLRLISVPRLFNLVLGDLDVADLVMHLKVSNTMASFMQGVVSVSEAEVASVAGSVAAHAMRKLLPPQQRIVLPNMTVVEGLLFRPLGNTTETPTIHEMMSHCPMVIGFHLVPRPANSSTGEPSDDGGYELLQDRMKRNQIAGQSLISLRGFLLAKRLQVFDPPEDQTWEIGMPAQLRPESVGECECAYSARTMLSTSPRRLTDLHFGLQPIADLFQHEEPAVARMPDAQEAPTDVQVRFETKDDWRAQVDLVGEICRDMMAESAANPATRSAITQALTATDYGEWDWTGLPVDLSSMTDHGHEVRLGAETAHLSPAKFRYRTLSFRRALRWRFDVVMHGPGETDAAPISTLPPDTAGALTLFHDLLVLGPAGNRFETPLVKNLTRDWRWACTTWRRPGIRVDLPWPAPPCSSIWGLDLFRSAWNHSVEHVFGAQHLPDMNNTQVTQSLLFAWLSAGTTLVDLKPPVPVTTVRSRSHPKQSDWITLKGRLEEIVQGLNKRTITRSTAASEWLVNVALLMMPEMGLPEPGGLVINESEALKEYWTRRRDAIKHGRVEMLAFLGAAGLEETAHSLRRDRGQGIYTPQVSEAYLNSQIAGTTMEYDEAAEDASSSSSTARKRPTKRKTVKRATLKRK